MNKTEMKPLVPFDFVSDSSKSASKVELTRSWLVANMYEGCSVGCSYCFRKRWNNDNSPKEVLSVTEAFDQIIQHPAFQEDYTPVTSNSSSTDPMHPFVKRSTLSLIDKLEKAGYSNPFGIITKFGIEEKDMIFLSKLQNVKPIILVTFSAMPHEIEPLSSENRINTMRMAKNYKIPVVLMYKPIVLGWNDSDDQMETVLTVARDYCDAITYNGLRLDKKIAQSIVERGLTLNYEPPYCWGTKYLPEEIETRLVKLHSNICPEIPLYNHTSCAISKILGIPNYNNFHKQSIEPCSSSCTATQYAICHKNEIM